MHSEPIMVHCSSCGRKGGCRENGIPPGWRAIYNIDKGEDILLCPVCWSLDG